jgi:putative hemolysin
MKFGKVNLSKLLNRRIYSKIALYKPNARIYSENKKYIIKTAENGNELEQALKLRYHVFYEEMGTKKRSGTIDIDKFDLKCDHLVVIDRASGAYVGTYRFNSSLYTKRYYSATEFNIKKIKALEGNKLEIGRACIQKEFRNSFLIAMLWKGMSDYIKTTQSRFLFGCSSIMTMEMSEIIPIYQYLMGTFSGGMDYRVVPRVKYRIKGFRKLIKQAPPLSESDRKTCEGAMPPLLRFYLKAGAYICGEPIIDKHFKCVDFFTLLDMTRVDKKIEEKFSS